MDGLTNEERALAWAASWHPSFSGKAIVNPDFTFRSVNQQFCDIVGVSQAELIGQRFQDITPPPIKQIDEKNSILVKKGVIDSYLLPKSYEFPSGKKVHIVLLVKGVYDKEGKFLFFLSRIMLDEEQSNIPSEMELNLKSFVKKFGHVFVGIGVAFGTALVILFKFFLAEGV